MNYTDRLPHVGFTLSESIGGSVPTIDVLKQGLVDRLGSGADNQNRITSSVDLAQEFRMRARLDYSEHEAGFEAPGRDSISLMFLDSLVYLGKSIELEQRHKREEVKYLQNGHAVAGIIEARVQLLESMADYSKTFAHKPDAMRYEGFECVYYEGACLLYDCDTISAYQEHCIRRDIVGLLGENKLLSGLKDNGFPLAHQASVEQDSCHETDIIVPIGDLRDRRSLTLQVKSTSKAGSTFLIESGSPKVDHLKVTVPVNEGNGWFDLPLTQLNQLKESISLHQ